MQREAYSNFETISDKDKKNTCGLKESYYDFNSISSGEDNLGAILYKLIAFERAVNSKEYLQGLLCIDEIEASLHPVAQIRLFDFLLSWCKKYKILLVTTTHSLYLIKHCLSLISSGNQSSDNEVSLTNISTMQVGSDHNFKFLSNPDYETIYRELTYINQAESGIFKVNILCEDQTAKMLISKILGRTVTKHIEILSDLSGDPGISWKGLASIAKNGVRLLDNSIIVLDADVDENKLKKLRFTRIMKLYDPFNLCLEKSIAKFIYDLNGDEELFKDNEKMAVEAWMADCHLNIENIEKDNVKNYKEWRKKHLKFFNEALKLFLKQYKKEFNECRKHMVDMINQCLDSKALPLIKIR